MHSSVEYTFTDISSSFFSKAARRFAEFDGILQYKTFDLEKDPRQQGFVLEYYGILHTNHIFLANRPTVAQCETLILIPLYFQFVALFLAFLGLCPHFVLFPQI